MPNLVDLTGRTFARLTVKSRAPNKPKIGNACWLCSCICGSTTIVPGNKLIIGHTKSCGCFNLDSIASRSRTHGLRKSAEYTVWNSMVTRCYTKSAYGFKYYGGRGIVVCDEWRGYGGFARFISDMGERPSARHQIDRIDNNGNYEKINCRWVTASQNVKHRRNAAERISEFYGVGWNKKQKKWAAVFSRNGKTIHAGSFDNDEDASMAVTLAMEKAGVGNIDHLLAEADK